MLMKYGGCIGQPIHTVHEPSFIISDKLLAQHLSYKWNLCVSHTYAFVHAFSFLSFHLFQTLISFIYLFRLSYFAIPTIFNKYHFQGCMWLNHRSNACLYLLSSFLFTLFLLSRFSVFIFVIRLQTTSNMIITIGSHYCEAKRNESNDMKTNRLLNSVALAKWSTILFRTKVVHDDCEWDFRTYFG